MGHQVSHAFAFTGLVVFIMAAPYLLVTYLGHTTMAFIVMQICLIVPFVIVANLAGKLTDCFGIDAEVVVVVLIASGSQCRKLDPRHVASGDWFRVSQWAGFRACHDVLWKSYGICRRLDDVHNDGHGSFRHADCRALFG